jgi:hypothetical protein
MQAKMNSRQAIQKLAGNDADFHVLDEDNTVCQILNQKAIDWALMHADEDALDVYEKFGKKLVTETDKITKSGPEWIMASLSVMDSKDKKQTLVRSPTLRTSLNFIDKNMAGNLFCKLLSPYRALEWIYVDSIIDHSKSKITATSDELVIL